MTGTSSDVSIAHLMYGSSVSHWNEPLPTTLEVYEKAYRVGVESGNYQYACYGLAHSAYTEFFCGFIPLPTLKATLAKYLEFVVRTGNKWATDVVRGLQFVISLLMSEKIDIPKAKEDFDALIAEFRSHQSRQPMCIMHIVLEFSSVLGSLSFPCLLDIARNDVITVAPQFLQPYVIFQFLDLLNEVEGATNRREMAEITDRLAKFRRMAEVSFFLDKKALFI
jgi:hypothetical protein